MSRILTELPQGFGSWEEYAAHLEAGNKELRGENMRLRVENDMDQLTGVMSRAAFSRAMRDYMVREEPFALGIADLDGFKGTNDTFGHAEGDKVLERYGGFLSGNVRRRGTDFVGRYGGDEFLLLLGGASGIDGAERIKGFLSRWDQAYLRMRREFGLRPETVNFSCGVSGYSGGEAYTELKDASVYREADAALLRAKGLGKNRVVLFEPQSHTLYR